MVRFRWSVVVLATYWIALAIATHWPVRLGPSTAPFSYLDKLAHLTGFGLLAILWSWTLWGRNAGWNHLFVSWSVLAFYAAVDEITQYWCPERVPDFKDWIADNLGIALGLVVYASLKLIAIRCGPPGAAESTTANGSDTLQG